MHPVVDDSRPWDWYWLPRFSRPFKSRPDINVPYFNVTLNQKDRVAPGFLFLAPFGSSLSGPLIYDHDGGLVWAGGEIYAAQDNHGPHIYCFYPCDYYPDTKTPLAGEAVHLCMNRGLQDDGTSRGEGMILGPDYLPVRTVRFHGPLPSIDLHEFSVVDNGTVAIMSQYRLVAADLSAYGIPGVGYVYDCVFQEQRLSDGAVLFEWSSMDHVSPEEANVTFYGGVAQDPWDYFHLNSVQRAADGSGDYLISARHTSTIYRISGRDGSIKWRLGGSRSDFAIAAGASPDGGGRGRWFHFQHDAVMLRSEAGGEVISLFDNGRTPNQILDSPFSRGLVMRLDSERRLATVEAEYFSEGRPQDSPLAGSMRGLANGNTLVGWGKTGCLTEFGGDMSPVFEACLLDEGRPALYRVHKSDRWVGRPLGKPSVVSYSRSGEATAVYVSWNGATEVRSWRVLGSEAGRAVPASDPTAWREILAGPRSGFETLLGPLPRFLRSVYAEALDAQGRVIGVSDAVETFVPSELHDGCDDLWCSAMVMVDVEETGQAVFGIGLGPDSWLYTPVLLYVAVSLCLAVLGLRYGLWRRWLAPWCTRYR